MRPSSWERLVIGILLFGICGCATGEGIKREGKGQIHYQLGVSYLNEGDATRALGELLKAKEYRPDDPEVLNALGLSFFSKGSREDAIESFSRAVELKPDFSEAHNNLGVLYLDMAAWDKAISCFKKALKNLLYPTPERARVNLGWAYYKKKDYLSAAEEFKRALVESPRFCLAHHYLGLAYMELKKFQEAVSEFRLAIKYCPKYVEAYLNLGMAYVKKGQTSDACAEFRRVKEFGEEGEFSRTAERYLVLLKCAQEKE